MLEPRSLLFVPAVERRFIDKAASRGADAVVLDLEDGVAPAAKVDARAALASGCELLRAQGATVFVRVNGDDPLLHGDVEAAVRAGVSAMVLPKVESPAQVQQLAGQLEALGSSARILALIETPLGVSRVNEIGHASRRLLGLCFGSEDFAAAMGVPPCPTSLAWPAQAVAIAALAAGIQPLGLPGSVGDFSDLGGYQDLVRHAKLLGMRGSVCIHPAQIAVINEVFGATTSDIAEAEKIVSAFEEALREGRGAIAVDGRMVDEPVAQRARLLLQRQGRRTTAINVGKNQ